MLPVLRSVGLRPLRIQFRSVQSGVAESFAVSKELGKTLFAYQRSIYPKLMEEERTESCSEVPFCSESPGRLCQLVGRDDRHFEFTGSKLKDFQRSASRLDRSESVSTGSVCRILCALLSVALVECPCGVEIVRVLIMTILEDVSQLQGCSVRGSECIHVLRVHPCRCTLAGL